MTLTPVESAIFGAVYASVYDKCLSEYLRVAGYNAEHTQDYLQNSAENRFVSTPALKGAWEYEPFAALGGYSPWIASTAFNEAYNAIATARTSFTETYAALFYLSPGDALTDFFTEPTP